MQECCIRFIMVHNLAKLGEIIAALMKKLTDV